MYGIFSPELRKNPGFETIDFSNKIIVSIFKKFPLILRPKFKKKTIICQKIILFGKSMQIKNMFSKNNVGRKINGFKTQTCFLETYWSV